MQGIFKENFTVWDKIINNVGFVRAELCGLLMNDKNLYSARNAEALGGKNVSHDAAKKVSFLS